MYGMFESEGCQSLGGCGFSRAAAGISIDWASKNSSALSVVVLAGIIVYVCVCCFDFDFDFDFGDLNPDDCATTSGEPIQARWKMIGC